MLIIKRIAGICSNAIYGAKHGTGAATATALAGCGAGVLLSYLRFAFQP